MKKVKSILGILLVGFMLTTVSCKDAKKEQSEKKGKEHTSAYICPMHCEDSGSDKEGKCPTCRMSYVKNKDYKVTDSQH